MSAYLEAKSMNFSVEIDRKLSLVDCALAAHNYDLNAHKSAQTKLTHTLITRSILATKAFAFLYIEIVHMFCSKEEEEEAAKNA